MTVAEIYRCALFAAGLVLLSGWNCWGQSISDASNGAPRVKFDVIEAPRLEEAKSDGARRIAKIVMDPKVANFATVDLTRFATPQREAQAEAPRLEFEVIEAPHIEARSIGAPRVAENDFVPRIIDSPSVGATSIAPSQIKSPAVAPKLKETIKLAPRITDAPIVEAQTTVPSDVGERYLVEQPMHSNHEPIADTVDTTDTAAPPESNFVTDLLDGSIPEVQSLANQNGASGLLNPYLSRAAGYQENQIDTSLSREFSPWWADQATNPIGIKPSPKRFSLDQLVHRALINSPRIQVAATAPYIRQAAMLEEAAAFDWLSFLESKYDDANDPIGNTLTTGDNSDRFVQQEWFARGGLRRRTNTGGNIEVAQRLGTLDNNSTFLIPPDQGNARLELNYRQPLRRGRGRSVNESLIVLARLDFQAAGDEFLQEVQTHLVDLGATYWELVRARSELLQRQRLLFKAKSVLVQLEGRSEVDALDRQIFRAKAAVARRKAEIARAVTSVRNAESRLRLLVNDDQVINAAQMEFVPTDLPSADYHQVDFGDAISTALVSRPDISRAIRDMNATSVRLGVARNDLLPRLDLLVGTYVAGLDGDSDSLNAWVNQFRDGRPGFNVGFDFEFPIGNRAARGREQQRQWELNRATYEFQAVVETGLTEVEIAVREVQTAYQEMQGRYEAMLAAANESEYLTDRWRTLPGADDSVTLLLENLLDSQERLADEEAAFAQAQFDYSVSTIKLKQATGTLFLVNSVSE